MWKFREEMVALRKRLQDQKDYDGVQVVTQAMIKLDDLSYDVNMYKAAAKGNVTLGRFN